MASRSDHRSRIHVKASLVEHPLMSNEGPAELPVRLPGGDQGIVRKAKVCDYLLSPNHPIGRFKAVFFSTLGYTTGEWERLQQDLLRLGQSGKVVTGQKSLYGQK